MSLRPVPTRWFRVLAPRSDCARVTGTLARTGAVEVEMEFHEADLAEMADLAAGLEHYRTLVSRYAPYWARGQIRHSPYMAAPRDTLARALGAIGNWSEQAEAVIDGLQAAEEELARMKLWERVLGCGGQRSIDFRLLGRAGPALDTLIAVFPYEAALPAEAPVLQLALPLGDMQCVLAVGATTIVQALRQQISPLKGRILERSPWMNGSAREVSAQVVARRLRLEIEVKRLYTELDALYEDCGLPEALGDLSCLQWFVAHVGTLPATRNLAWVTGWTDDLDGTRLARALAAGEVRGLLQFTDPPAGREPPQILSNPPWIRPFEIFARALGTPGAAEPDPSPWLAVVVPILFGYMFGDVGQGLVLFAIGWFLRRRFALAPLLMVAGLSATFFGFLFGSLFSFEGVLPPLWFSPMHEPLLTLGLPLGFAVLLLTLSQALNALEHAWRGQLQNWLLTEAGLLLIYLGVVAGLLDTRLFLLAWTGVAWHLLGHAWAKGRLSGLFKGLGTLVEDGQRLLVNTVSFARVGAFALAHGGLSSAVVTLAGISDSSLVALLILILGNALIIALEGLVVSIQTTRLVLFEFFLRFLRGEGRPFRPLPAPPAALQGVPS